MSELWKYTTDQLLEELKRRTQAQEMTGYKGYTDQWRCSSCGGMLSTGGTHICLGPQTTAAGG